MRIHTLSVPKEPFSTKVFLVAASLSDFEILIKCKYPYILTSFWFTSKVFQKGIKSFKDLFEYFNADIKDYEIFLDSGSYSITSGGHTFTDKEIYNYLDNYIEFIYANRNYISLYCNLDLQFKEDRSKEYYRYLCANGLHDSIQVFHRPERFRFLDEIIEKYQDQENSIIGLSPQPSCSPTIKYEFTKRCLALANNGIKVHLLGSIDYKILTSFNVYSADSSGAARLAATGGIRTPVGTFDTGNRRSDPQHIYNQTPQKIKNLEEYLETLGYNISDVTGTDLGTSRIRLEITIRSYLHMMERIKENKKLVELPSRKEIMKIPYSKTYGSYWLNGKFPTNWK